MSSQPFERPIPVHNEVLHGRDDKLSRASIGAGLRAKLDHSIDSIGRAFRAWSAPSPWAHEEPIRAELFGIERLEQHAESLATAQRTASKLKSKRRLDARLRDNNQALRAAYHATVETVRAERTITPAANWLLDNFHVVEQQVREIRVDLPPSFYRQLPKLMEGPLEGYPRVFGLAWAFVAHTDSHFEPEMLRRFAAAYQRVQPLTIGELWAIPITIRIVLVENLRRLADDIVRCQAARQEADALADRLLDGNSHETEAPDMVLRGVEDRLRVPFAVQLIQRLCDQDPKEVPALRWLYERLATQGTTADDIVREEHQRQGAVNVTVRNVITSIHLISVIDWKELIENVSLVDAMLRAESDFAAMDFPTIERAVRERMAALPAQDPQTYWERLCASEVELQELIEAVVVPETWFFRDREEFRCAEEHGSLGAAQRVGGADCSRVEPALRDWGRAVLHSHALLDAGVPASRLQIDAVDISLRAIAYAERAAYGRRTPFAALISGFGSVISRRLGKAII